MSDDKKQIREMVSKRIIGGVLMAIAIVLSVLTWKCAIDKSITDSVTAVSVINSLFLAGGALLGIDVAGKVLTK